MKRINDLLADLWDDFKFPFLMIAAFIFAIACR